MDRCYIEDDILTSCALRFDGWKFKETTGFDHEQALDHFWRTGEWNISPDEQLATFFMLQQGLCQRGLEQQPRHSKRWRALRSLFLRVHSYAIPEGYRAPEEAKEWVEKWEQGYRRWLEMCVTFITRIHESTPYEDDGRLDE